MLLIFFEILNKWNQARLPTRNSKLSLRELGLNSETIPCSELSISQATILVIIFSLRNPKYIGMMEQQVKTSPKHKFE